MQVTRCIAAPPPNVCAAAFRRTHFEVSRKIHTARQSVLSTRTMNMPRPLVDYECEAFADIPLCPRTASVTHNHDLGDSSYYEITLFHKNNVATIGC